MKTSYPLLFSAVLALAPIARADEAPPADAPAVVVPAPVPLAEPAPVPDDAAARAAEERRLAQEDAAREDEALVAQENKAKAEQLDKLAANPDMVKGELSSLGVTKLQTKNTRIGLRLGATVIDDMLYASGTLDFDLMWRKLGIGLSAPMRVPLHSSKDSASEGWLPQGFTIRKEDYDELSEFLRLVRFVRWGGKEEKLYVNVGTESPATIGHGNLVRRYMANVDVDRGRLSGEIDWYGSYGGFEAFVGDLTSPLSMISGVGFVKPFGGSETQWLKSLSVGVEVAADLNAPYLLKRASTGYPELATGSTVLPIVQETRQAQIVGVSIETKLVKTESADVKPFLELSQMGGGGAGGAFGALGRFSWGKEGETRYALRFVVEARAFQGNFLPGYFDTFYEFQKYQFISGGGAGDAKVDQTKLFDVLSRPNDLKLGYYTEAQLAWVDNIAFTASFEDSQAKGGRNLVLHLEVPTLERLRFFASLHRRNIEGNPFAFDAADPTSLLNANNTLFFAGLRFRVLPILYINARAFRNWKMNAAANVAGYENVTGVDLDVELGYEFTRD